MPDQIESLIERIHALEVELEEEFHKKRKALNMRIVKGRAVFDAEVERQQTAMRTGLLKYIRTSRPMFNLTAPFIYAVIIPLVLLDIFVTIYQAVCFPVYGLKKVQRKAYIVFDRHQLRYLNGLEKLNCTYCAYANGLLAYVVEIAARTEEYWCPIKHARKVENAHRHYPRFAEYGDAEAFRKRMADLDKILKKKKET